MSTWTPMVPGVAYPQARTYAVQADVGEFLAALLEAWPAASVNTAPALPRPHPQPPEPGRSGSVRPAALMGAVQRVVVDGSDAVVFAESGNSFTWATHYLRFAEPGRYRVSTNLGSMGHAATGVLGAAIGAGRAVAIVGDGAMLMNCGEVNTAVKRGLATVWIVLNDGRYNMCEQGMAALGMNGLADACFPPVDFALPGQCHGRARHPRRGGKRFGRRDRTGDGGRRAGGDRRDDRSLADRPDAGPQRGAQARPQPRAARQPSY